MNTSFCQTLKAFISSAHAKSLHTTVDTVDLSVLKRTLSLMTAMPQSAFTQLKQIDVRTSFTCTQFEGAQWTNSCDHILH